MTLKVLSTLRPVTVASLLTNYLEFNKKSEEKQTQFHYKIDVIFLVRYHGL